MPPKVRQADLPFKPEREGIVFWDPLSRCRQYSKQQSETDLVVKYPCRTFKEYQLKIKPARARSDLDQCEWLKPIMAGFQPEKHIFKITSKRRDGSDFARWEYNWATRVYENAGREKIYRVTV